MEREEEPKKGFKVVDRRRFDEAGDERTGPDVGPKEAPTQMKIEAPPKPQAAPPPAAKEEAKKKEPEPPADPNAISFSVFLQSMAQQTLMQLGLIPWPHGQRELALEQARDSIDVLSLLRTKTKGNLTAEEDSLFETVLYELRMSYLEVNNAIARQAAQASGLGPRGPGAPRR
jgi:hypothetical protein